MHAHVGVCMCVHEYVCARVCASMCVCVSSSTFLL